MKSRGLMIGAMVAVLGAWYVVPVRASDNISVDSKSISTGTDTTAVPVRFTGDQNVSALVLTVQIGDGGPVLGGTENLTITGFDLTDGIFDPSLFDMAFSPPGVPNGTVKINISPNSSHPGLNVTANGLIGTLLLDTHLGTLPRTVTIYPTVTDPFAYPTLMTRAQDSLQNDLSLTFTNGTLQMTVPEPASLSLLAVGGILLWSRRQRKTG